MKKWVSPIPKKVHFIWLGSDPPDYFQKYFLQSFEKNMSEFEISLWTDKDLTKSNFPKKNLGGRLIYSFGPRNFPKFRWKR